MLALAMKSNGFCDEGTTALRPHLGHLTRPPSFSKTAVRQLAHHSRGDRSLECEPVV